MVQYQILGKDLDKIFDLYGNYAGNSVVILKNQEDKIKLLRIPTVKDNEESLKNYDKTSWNETYIGYIEFEDEESALYYSLKYDLTLSINTI